MKMQKLLNIQKELKAPKSQYNSFGKYNYRNCEDIWRQSNRCVRVRVLA